MPPPSLPALECFEKPNEWAMSRALFANSWLLTASEMSDHGKLIAYKGLITYCPKSKMVLIARCIYVETSNYVFRTDNPLSNFGPMQTLKNHYMNTLYISETIKWFRDGSDAVIKPPSPKEASKKWFFTRNPSLLRIVSDLCGQNWWYYLKEGYYKNISPAISWEDITLGRRIIDNGPILISVLFIFCQYE